MNQKPNILFILTDDQGAWAMHCAGNNEISTPNLDRIAEEGMRFDNFFCASPVCSPARASLLTGTIPSAHGVLDWLRAGNVDKEKFARQSAEDPYGGYVDEHKAIQYLAGKITYTDVLAQNGYTCALSGKWHLGDSITPQHGFRYWYTIGRGGCCYYHADIVEKGDIHVAHGEYVTDLITEKALEFLDELSEKPEPFYLSVHYTAPHAPWEAEHHPKKWIDMYEDCPFTSTPDVPDHPGIACEPMYGTPRRREKLRGYYAAVTAMDDGVGKLLDFLDKRGLKDNTIVIFSSDNGMNMGHHGIWGKGNGTRPMNMYDTSIKVPFLMRYPGVVPSGSVCRQMVSAYDFFPTLLDLLKLDAQQIQKLPGKSFADALCGEVSKGRESVVIFDEYGPVRMIRSEQYKYIHRYPYGPDEFYDLTKDPNEEHNLIDDPQMEQTILQMRRQMEQWFNRYADPDIDASREGVTGSGQLCSAGVYAQQLMKYAPAGANS